jgi:folate-binding protein YgfZ
VRHIDPIRSDAADPAAAGSDAGGYEHLREAAGVGSIGPRRQIAVSGADRASYLQGLLTNDVAALGPGEGCYAAWLTPQGRMLTDMHVLESGDSMLLDVPADRADATFERLDRFLFSEDVQLGRLDGALADIWVHGPRAETVLASAVSGLQGAGEWNPYRLRRAELDGASIVIARIDQLGVPGFGVYLPSSAESALRAALARGGAVEAASAAVEALRIEAGYPLFGVDMTEDTIPLEAGIEGRAISFSKGCYVGQEVIIRVLHRGGGRVARRLVGLRIDGAPPERGAKVRAADRDVGFVTSATISPAYGTIALGYVHRDLVEPGSAVQVMSPDGLMRAAVSRLPFERR